MPRKKGAKRLEFLVDLKYHDLRLTIVFLFNTFVGLIVHRKYQF